MADVTLKLVVGFDGKAAVAGLRGLQGGVKDAGGAMQREFSASGKAAVDLGASIDKAKTRLLAFASIAAVGAAAKQIGDMADAYTNLTSKLRNVTGTEAELARVREQVLSIAQNTRQEYESTATLYARLTRATEDLGLAESQRLKITDTINKAMVVSGASAQEASAAIIQLSQGLAAGALRGEEFNSVAEQAPILLDLVAQATGKTRGELRAMAQDGEITSAVLTGALLQGASTVDAQFANMGLTIGGAAQQMKNAALEWVGQSEAISGAADMTASALSGIGRNFAAIADAAANAALALSAVFAGRWLSGLRESVGAWNAKRAAMLETAKATAIAAESEAVLAARENAAIQRSIQRATQDIRVAEVQLEVGRSATLRAAAEERLAIAHRQLDAAQNQLYDNTQRGIAARAALKEATDGVAKSTLNFANIGKSAFAMIGGWTTVIIAAAAAVYGIAESMVNGSAEVQKMTDDLNASSESVEKNAAAALKMRLGVSEGMAGAAVEVDKLTAKLAELQAQQEPILFRVGFEG